MNVSNSGLSSISGLDQFTHLYELILKKNIFTSLADFKSCSGVKLLDLSENYVSEPAELGHLKTCHQLIVLSL